MPPSYISSCALPILLAATIPLPALADTSAGTKFGELRLQFLYDGKEVPGSLIVSDGKFRKEWRNAPRITAQVPTRATYIIDLKPPGDTAPQRVTFRDVVPEFDVPAGGVRDVIVHVPKPGGPDAFDPFIFVEDRQAKATIVSRLEVSGENRERVRIISNVRQAPGTRVLIDGIYMKDADRPEDARDYTCGANCPHMFNEIDCSVHCYTCTSTAVYDGYWKGNYNMCEGLTSEPPPGSDFDVLPEGIGGVHLAAATRNDGIVFPLRSSLRSGETAQDLTPPLNVRSFPDFTAPAGYHLYSVTLPGGDGGAPETLNLPVNVADGRITQLYIKLPAAAPEAVVPMLIGDDRLGIPERSLRHEATGKRVTIYVKTDDPDPGHAWVLVPVPERSKVRVTDPFTGKALSEHRDYAVTPLGVVVLTAGSMAAVTVAF
ncbi:hypothetical protein [Chelativorans sp. M5D2P16]|uniref:hypothetical protein n=1 Tax=Chelativorans sp. M5D2P16 TaxID=3095678 RepID=UPI002ACA48B2|nr:hypothetical protein [Chelativorans sp. M5D2P16]MDZ5696231.1 hypothetical protein [Chelativorans sp. M5D2P16]